MYTIAPDVSTDLLRKRGAERGVPDGRPSTSSSSTSSLVRAHLSRLGRTMVRSRTRVFSTRSLCLLLGMISFAFCALCVLLYQYPSLEFLRSESAEEWLRRHIVCPTDTLIDIPPLRSRATPRSEGEAARNRTPAFAFEASTVSGIPGQPPTVAGLDGFCAAQVSAVPRWASGKWRAWSSLSRGARATHDAAAALFNLTIAPNFLNNATYTAVGSPLCLVGGGLYLPQKRIDVGGVNVFQAAGLTVLPLTDAVLRKAARSNVSAGLHMVPAMGLLFSGYWIATHFFHLITDALETLYGAFHTMEDGVLQHIPTQTVMIHRDTTDWIDRRGDKAKKMEFSAALANAFSSPLLHGTSPYNTSFLIRPDMPYCVGRGGEQRRFVAGAAGRASTSPSADAAASAVCFCDGLLVTTHNHPFMDARIYYGVQDWAARAFDAPSYLPRRSVHEMEHMRLARSPSWAAQFWLEDTRGPAPPSQGAETANKLAAASTAAASSPYHPRAVFVHRTTRLIANATRYAAWMREAGFRVEEVYMERLSAAQQYHLGRYADVIVAMHGLGIGHAMWMEREPHGCRTVIEFRPWVIWSMPLQPQRVLGQTMKFHFVAIQPKDVRFGPSVKDPVKERELLLSIERINSAFSYSSFTDQTAYYDDAEVRRVIWAVRQHLDRCLPT